MKEVITSAQNQHIRYLQSLLQKKNRDTEGKFLLEGLRLVEEAVAAGAPIEEVLLSPEFMEKRPELMGTFPEGISVTPVAQHLFKKFSDTEQPQGIAALVRKEEYGPGDVLAGAAPFILVIEQVQDPGNLGTIIRTADAAGVTGIIVVRGTVDLFNPKTLRATMGSVFHLPVITVDSITEACRILKQHQVRVFATDVSADARDYLAGDYTGSVALVVGNEANGISPDAREEADELIAIKMPGKAESLNVAVATGIMLFEIARQRQGFSTQIT